MYIKGNAVMENRHVELREILVRKYSLQSEIFDFK
jgi:hypothetical protein